MVSVKVMGPLRNSGAGFSPKRGRAGEHRTINSVCRSVIVIRRPILLCASCGLQNYSWLVNEFIQLHQRYPGGLVQ